jgi:hypothetical protein
MGGSWWNQKLISGRRWQSGAAMISSHVRRRPTSNTDAGLMTRMTVVVSTRPNSVGDASRYLDPRHAIRVRQHYFLPFAILGMALLHWEPAAGVWLRRPSLVAKPAAGMPIPKISYRFVKKPALACQT